MINEDETKMSCDSCGKAIKKEYWKLDNEDAEETYCSDKCLLEVEAVCWVLPKKK